MSDLTQELDPQETMEFVNDVLLPEIEEGVYDEHIRKVARACFARRDVLKGTNTVIPDAEAEASALASEDEPVARFQGYSILPHNSRVAIPPGKRAAKGEKVFYLGRNRYHCSEFVGRVFEIPSNANPKGLRGLYVRIDDFNVNKSVTRFNATLLEHPTNNRVKRFHQGSTLVFPVELLAGYTADGYGS